MSHFDLIVAGARVVDGTGSPWFRADIGTRGDRIVSVGDLRRASSVRRIDAHDMVVAPGFIDMLGQSEYSVLVDGRAASKIAQGITTEITGEGTSVANLNDRMIEERRAYYEHYGVVPDWSDLDGYFREFERRGATINLGTLVGAGGVRNFVIGQADRPPTVEEMQAMEAAVERAMVQGAFGLSSALLYMPDSFATTEELIALARVAAHYGGTYITHQRNEGSLIDESLEEVLRIAREASIATEIYHLKLIGQPNWGRMPEMLGRIESARADGLDVIANAYPWNANGNNLHASLPIWVQEGGVNAMVERLTNPVDRLKAREGLLTILQDDLPNWKHDGAEAILVTMVINPDLKRFEGRTIKQIADEWSVDPLDAIIDLVIADRGNTERASFLMDETDVRAALAHPLVAFCTDTAAAAEDGILSMERSHPRGWGSATRILGHYVRELGIVSLEEAIRKMTSLPARRMRLTDRGQIRPGAFADLVVFDPETVGARSTFTDPNHYSEGVRYVAVNGRLVVDDGEMTSARPGRPMRPATWAG